MRILALAHLVLLLWGVLKFIGAEARVVGAAVLPHGDFAYDPSLVDFKNGSVELHMASHFAGKWLELLHADVILLSTPHGLSVSKDFAFYDSSFASGTADIGQDVPGHSTYQVNLTTRIDSNLTKTIARSLQATNFNVTSMSGFGGAYPFPLEWGEIIPLSFLRNLLPQTPVLVLSHPARRYSESVEMIPELQRLGQTLGSILNQRPERIVVLISADLAHTHQASGPYGYSSHAQPFDDACVLWARTLDSLVLVQDAANHVNPAKSCGFTGLVLLDGLIKGTGLSSAAAAPKWQSEVLAYAHPTYYGMMVALFRPSESSAEAPESIRVIN